MSDTPTPRTDNLATTLIDGEFDACTPQVPADFSRELERENIKLREEKVELVSILNKALKILIYFQGRGDGDCTPGLNAAISKLKLFAKHTKGTTA